MSHRNLFQTTLKFIRLLFMFERHRNETLKLWFGCQRSRRLLFLIRNKKKINDFVKTGPSCGPHVAFFTPISCKNIA